MSNRVKTKGKWCVHRLPFVFLPFYTEGDIFTFERDTFVKPDE